MTPSRPSRRGRRLPGSHLEVESLEPRIVLAADLGIEFRKGVVTITGSEGNDVAEVSQPTRNTVVVSLSGVASKSFRASSVKTIVFNGLGGDDVFTNNTAIRSRADGGTGADVLRGGRASDDLRGGDDDDQLFGNGGNDTLHGGTGDDFVDGGDGNDKAYGEAGEDDIYGGRGRDTLRGGTENDDLYGNDDNDDLDGEQGDDYLDGQRGRDRIRGGSGLDREDDAEDRFEDGDRDDDGYDDDHDAPVNPDLATTITFLPADAAPETNQTAQITGESLNERDRKYYKFVAPAGKSTLTVTLLPDANGMYAELEIKNGTTGGEVLELEPAENGITTAAMSVVPGTLYIVKVNSSYDFRPAGYTADLLLDNSAVSPIIGTEIVLGSNGAALLTGSLTSNEKKKLYSFTATTNGTLSVAIQPVNGRSAEVEVENRATSVEVLELDPDSRNGRNSGSFAVVAGQTYVFQIEKPSDSISIDYIVSLQLS